MAATTWTATFENEWVFRADEEACDEYQAYLADHDAYRVRGGILYAEDFVGWLNDSRTGQSIRDRICSERADDIGSSFPDLQTSSASDKLFLKPTEGSTT